MFCQQCGSELKETAKFCSQCGKPVHKKPICPACKTECEEDAVYCRNCGTYLGVPTPADPGVYAGAKESENSGPGSIERPDYSERLLKSVRGYWGRWKQPSFKGCLAVYEDRIAFFYDPSVSSNEQKTVNVYLYDDLADVRRDNRIASIITLRNGEQYIFIDTNEAELSECVQLIKQHLS